MDCAEVQERLSTYYDGELDDESSAALERHLADCGQCVERLAGFKQLSSVARELTTPEAPGGLWPELERLLDAKPRVRSSAGAGGLRMPQRALLALAGALLLGLAIGWAAYEAWREPGGHAAVEFGPYLEKFQQSPRQAQQFLLARYDGKRVDFEEAREQLGYRPAAEGLPPEYSVQAVYVWKMPCCKCIQCLCKRKDGSTVAVFEHDELQPEWFGDRPQIKSKCEGMSCSIYQAKSQIAASWSQGRRHITVVGLRDVGEVNEFVASFERPDIREGPPRAKRIE